MGTAVAAVLALPSIASADEMLSPISLGAVANRDFQAATVGFGMGPYDDKLHLLFFGRAAVGPTLNAGMGGVSGGYAFVERDHFHFGVDLGVSVGGGRYRGAGAGVLAAAEPGLFMRFLSEKIGAIHVNAGWYQPVYVRHDGVGGAAMLSLAWSPFYDR
ncbi:MAG: hypothetical protein KDK70_35785 [Myxococcales bacterium]|nr:hypothetical protein [Myxococcales bacterium]